MKKLLIVLFLIIMLDFIKVSAFSPTGHDGISSVEFIEEDGYSKLLVDIKQSDINNGYKAMGKGKFWGWKDHYFCINEKVNYVGEIIFSKSNRTSETININYVLEETKVHMNSVKITGSVSGKVKGNIKKANVETSAEVKGEKENKSTISRNEETKFNLSIKPNKKITFRVTGEAVVSNGLSKYYIFGINSKKGTWEIINIYTQYYELYEESI